MSDRDGKFGVPDPEDRARMRLTKTVTPQLAFKDLFLRVQQARAQGPVYDSIWSVLESLTFEMQSLKEEIASQKEKIASQESEINDLKNRSNS